MWRKTYSGVQKINISGVIFEVNFDQLESNIYTKQMIYQCYELHMVAALKKYLKPGGIFIDVGANVGYLSAVGASLVGQTGKVISFEPVPVIFQTLQNITTLNPNYKITVCNKAISENDCQLLMDCTTLKDCGGSTAVSGFLDIIHVEKKHSTTVNAIRLDGYLLDNDIQDVSLIKIDVEGFEFSVLKSLEKYFSETPFRPIVICELAPAALKLLDLTVKDLFNYMMQFGYHAYDIYDCETPLDGNTIYHTTDVVFKTA
ncbi:MAG: FkbM family methyltransferase [Gammaproteobacteria bacterium]|nr:FkbM family methyltransferase [Gammaproteobacteria bacterium]